MWGTCCETKRQSVVEMCPLLPSSILTLKTITGGAEFVGAPGSIGIHLSVFIWKVVTTTVWAAAFDPSVTCVHAFVAEPPGAIGASVDGFTTFCIFAAWAISETIKHMHCCSLGNYGKFYSSAPGALWPFHNLRAKGNISPRILGVVKDVRPAQQVGFL